MTFDEFVAEYFDEVAKRKIDDLIFDFGHEVAAAFVAAYLQDRLATEMAEIYAVPRED